MQIKVVYRVTNDMHCNLGAVAEYDDSQPGPPVGKFSHYGVIPGAGIAHNSIVYDDVSDLYFMASNFGRNSLQPWDPMMPGEQCVSPLTTLQAAFPANDAW
jgi:hypothetical protein